MNKKLAWSAADMKRFARSVFALVIATVVVAFILESRKPRAERRSDTSCMMGSRVVFDALGFCEFVRTDGDSNYLGIEAREFDPSSGQMYESDFTQSASFYVRHVCARHANELFVWGETRDGLDVLERWSILEVRGAFASFRPTSAAPMGTSTPIGTSSVYVVGGSYIPPSQRRTPDVQRDEIYRGSIVGQILDMAVDPEGRFVFALSAANQSIYVVPLSGNGTPQMLYDPPTISHLSVSNRVDVFDHLTEGRKYLVTRDEGIDDRIRIVLSDTNNDALFETVETLDGQQWEARGYAGNVWTADYVHFR